MGRSDGHWMAPPFPVSPHFILSPPDISLYYTSTAKGSFFLAPGPCNRTQTRERNLTLPLYAYRDKESSAY